MVDLRLVGETQRSHAELWADRIQANNDHHLRLGQRPLAGANAPAMAASFVVRSPERVVLLSLLHTASQCQALLRDERARIIVRRCPMRLAIYERAGGRVLDAGFGCVVERQDSAHASAPDRAGGAYAAYDRGARAIRLAVVAGGRRVGGCDLAVPVPPAAGG